MNQEHMHEQQLMSPAPHDRLHQFIDGSTGLKEDGQADDGAIRITNNDLGIDAVGQFNPGSQALTSSKKSMNKKDYQKSIKYIENFYQQNNKQAAEGDSTSQARQDESGMLFDDAPKSVTEESSMIGDEKHMAAGALNKIQPPGTANIPNRLYKPDGSLG